MDTNLAPSTLTESLLDDLDDLSETEGINRQDEFSEQQEEVIDEPSNETIDTKLPSHWHHHSSKNPHKRLLEDPALQKHLLLIRRTMQNQATLSEKNDYELITSTNKFLSILMDELHRVHTELKSAYKAKFPELEELLTDPILYRKAIGVIQNEMDLTLMNEQLNVIAGLSPNQIITLSVAASTTAGRPLTDIELQNVQSICDYLDEVHSIQVEFISFIEHRMDHLAPNICAIIGPTLAARMVGLAGGLLELSRIPSCNLIVLGQNKHTSASRSGLGMSLSIGTVSGLHRLHQGILGECELVTQCPVHLQRKVLKLVANKLALAIRADVVNVESSRKRTRDTGINLRREIEDKIEKLEEPDKAPTIKALPKPDMETKNRRGGKRIRRLKERFEETDLMKQANRRGFASGVGEYGDDSMGLTLGMLDSKQGTGNARSLLETAEKRKMRQADSKASRKRATQASWNASRHGGTVSGMASSMSFTPVQGLELVNPDANKQRVRDANRKWFEDNAGFQSALPRSNH